MLKHIYVWFTNVLLYHVSFFMKASSLSTYKIAEQDFSYFFPDDPPTFIFSPANKRRGRPPKRGSVSQVGREWIKTTAKYLVALNTTQNH